jgi:glucose-1-phosphate thymidylyltransferase
MIAVVPVAGVGTRLRPHTHTLPKALVHVAGKPILGHILDTLVEHGVQRVVLVTGYMGDRIERYVRDHYKIDAAFVEQPERRGLGHAIWLTRKSVQEGPLLIILGDTLFQADFAALRPQGPHRIGVKAVEDPHRFGVVELAGNRIVRLVEKPEHPPSSFAIVGVYYLTRSGTLFTCLDELIRTDRTTRGEFQLTDALQMMIERGEEMDVLPIEGWFDCGQPDALLEANRHLLARMTPSERRDGCTLIPPVWLDPTCLIEESVVGPNVSVGARAVIRESILRDTIVGEDAEVERSLLEASLIGEHSQVRGVFRKLNLGNSSQIEIA